MENKLTVGIYICHYNTNELTNNCIKSILDKVKSFDYSINVFDNSDEIKFDNIYHVNVIDNTKSQLINFDDYTKKSKVIGRGNFASAKHTLSIDYILKNSNYDNILLLDSDTLVLKDIDFIDDNYITIAKIQIHENDGWKRRFMPCIQYFNCKEIKEKHLDYYDPNRIRGICYDNPNIYIRRGVKYDTGASFYEDILKYNYKYKEINHDYIRHFKNCSWLKKPWIKK